LLAAAVAAHMKVQMLALEVEQTVLAAVLALMLVAAAVLNPLEEVRCLALVLLCKVEPLAQRATLEVLAVVVVVILVAAQVQMQTQVLLEVVVLDTSIRLL
jgi:hypothetical protein